MYNLLSRSLWKRLGWSPSENTLLLALAVAVGITTAGGIWLFRHGFEFFQAIYRESLLDGLLRGLGVWAIIPILALAGLIVGAIMDRFIGEERHHGVAGIMESAALAGGRLRYRRMPIKAGLASFSIGAGASVGPEDPSVQIGANLGSMFGQWLHLSDERMRLLVAAGAASGIAAVFRAPIAGVFFALEVILGDLSTSAFGVVVLAAVIASIVTQSIDPGSFELGIRSYALGGIGEVPFYIVLGVLVAPLSALFIRLLYWQHDTWHHIQHRLHLSRPVKTMLAGIVVGLIAVFLPQIMGTGSEVVNAFLNQKPGEFTIGLLLALTIGKMLATTISLGGGFVGGMFAPSLFVGAAFGGAFGLIVNQLFPTAGLTANPAAYAMVGMAAAMTGVIRAPITAVLLLFELTGDYTLILPIMLVAAVSLLVVDRLAPDGIYQFGLARKGVRLAQGRDIDLLQTVTVGEAMTTDPQLVPADLPASQLQAEFDRTNTHGLLVVNGGHALYGIVTLQDLAKASEVAGFADKTVGDICTCDLITVTPDDSIATAFRKISLRDVGRLPVIAAEDSNQVVGMLRRRDMIRAYDIALQRKIEGQYRAGQVRLETYSQGRVIELRVERGAVADGKLISQITWPEGSIVATIRRRSRAIVPRGSTRLQAGDVLTVVMTGDQEAALRRLVANRAPA
ncbi:MAG: chloride channel protein [Anaerolineae bacterium]|nr:chloride channel protein [Anaerolineae bacterium]